MSILRKNYYTSNHHNKILSVHSRLAEEKVIEIIEKYKPRKCIIHWFSGNKEQLRKLIDLGCYFSINTIYYINY